MGNLSGATLIAAQDLWTESSVAQHKLGQLGVDTYGNRYRYVKAGGSALVTGNLLQEPAEDTNFRSMAVNTAAAIGTDEISVTLGGTAVTAGMFDDGLLCVESSTGIGQLFRIKSHTVQTSTTGSCTFTVDRKIKIALTTSSQVSVRKNPYNGVIQYPVTTQTGGAVGIALYAMTASYYGWIQSGGDAVALFDTGTNSSNGASGIGPSSAVAGSVKPQTGAEGGIVIGYSREVASVDSTMSFVHLTID
jgi:hypothetical protein